MRQTWRPKRAKKRYNQLSSRRGAAAKRKREQAGAPNASKDGHSENKRRRHQEPVIPVPSAVPPSSSADTNAELISIQRELSILQREHAESLDQLAESRSKNQSGQQCVLQLEDQLRKMMHGNLEGADVPWLVNGSVLDTIRDSLVHLVVRDGVSLSCALPAWRRSLESVGVKVHPPPPPPSPHLHAPVTSHLSRSLSL